MTGKILHFKGLPVSGLVTSLQSLQNKLVVTAKREQIKKNGFIVSNLYCIHDLLAENSEFRNHLCVACKAVGNSRKKKKHCGYWDRLGIERE